MVSAMRPLGPVPTGADTTASATSEIGSLYGDGTGGYGGQVWAQAIYTDANHPYAYNDGSGVRIFDRKMPNAYARPLWDTSMGNITSYFPGLVNRNAPDNTIVTHCPHHRSWFGSAVSTQQDLIVRLGGDTGKLRLVDDWAVQRQTSE